MNMRRIWAVTAATTVVSVSAIVPAIANTSNGKYDDGQEAGDPIGLMNAILWFVLLPASISAIIALLVLAPGWNSSARKSTQGGFLDDPTLADRQVTAETKRGEISN